MTKALIDNHKILDALNQDLAAEWGAILRYTTQAARATGIRGVEFRDFLRKEIQDELRHATFLSEVISDLGGQPTRTPKEFAETDGIESMVQQDLMLEQEDVEHYSEHARWAEQAGHIELKVRLEEMAADESRHARELNRILKGM